MSPFVRRGSSTLISECNIEHVAPHFCGRSYKNPFIEYRKERNFFPIECQEGGGGVQQALGAISGIDALKTAADVEPFVRRVNDAQHCLCSPEEAIQCDAAKEEGSDAFVTESFQDSESSHISEIPFFVGMLPCFVNFFEEFITDREVVRTTKADSDRADHLVEMGCHKGDMSFVCEIGVCDFVAQWRQIPFLDVCIRDEFLHDRMIVHGCSTNLDLLDCGHDRLLLSLCSFLAIDRRAGIGVTSGSNPMHIY